MDPPGYAIRQVLGRGGMGEVLLATDEDLARPVAIKRMLGTVSAEQTDRFLREARIQARLEHPSIVPVHELGSDADGRPYFTMRRLAGQTLAEILTDGRPLQQLLRAFVDVCRAIDLAHARGVIHRDLKPANIMLGDYGEVYVLDWGVARIIGEDEPDAGQTAPGMVLGTPGYMAPEQECGDDVGYAADAYALGRILDDILLASGRPTEPELAHLVIDAMAADPARRPTARMLAEHVERYLDGDRDVARRRQLARDHLAHARLLVAAADRGGAIKAAGRALALDPELAPAADLASSLILEPPRQLSTDVQRHLATVDHAFARKLWGQVAFSFIAFFVFVPMMAWQGVLDPWTLAGVFGIPASLALYSIYLVRGGTPRNWVYLVFGSIGMMFVSRLFGPFMVLPGLLAISLVGYTMYPPFMKRPYLPIATVIATFAIPLVLEQLGVLASTWELVGDTIVIRSPALALGGTPTIVILIAVHVMTFAVLGLFAWSLANARREAQRAVEIQAWHLRKLLA